MTRHAGLLVALAVAIVAHAVTNALIAADVVLLGAWRLWL